MTAGSAHTYSRIKSFYSVHSRSEFEAIFRYPLFDDKSPSHLNSSFDLQTYIVSPVVLDVDADHYSKDDFYKDLKAMVRLRQPKLNFGELMGNEDATPMDYIAGVLATQDFAEKPQILKQAIKEAKLFGVAFNRHVYRSARKKSQKIRKLVIQKPSVDKKTLLNSISRTLDKGALALKEWTLLVAKSKKLQNDASEAFVNTMTSVEEYCYYVYLDSCVYVERILMDLQEKESSENVDFTAFIAELHKKCAAPHKQAVERFGYPEGESPDYKSLQNYGLARGALKKNIQSVLYLNARSQPFFAISKQLGAMLAAGIAASWAIAMEIAIIVQTGFGGLSSGGFGLSTMVLFSAFIFAYVLKDRIKEFGRKRFHKGVFFKIPDNRNQIVYNTVENKSLNIGRLDESMEYTPFTKLPSVIRDTLNKNRIFAIDDERTILVYNKLFSINAKSLRKHDDKLTSAHDIFRYNISRFLPFLDEPAERMSGYFSSQRAGQWLVPKSYYFDILFVKQFKAGKSIVSEDREMIRMLINKKGIIQVKRLNIA